jgi:hypothetical protein
VTRSFAVVFLATIVASCNSRETRRAAACIDYKVPDGWTEQKQPNGDIAIVNPKPSSHGLRESFTIRFTPGDRGLEQTRDQLVRLANPSMTAQVADQFQKKKNARGVRVTLEDLPPPEVTPLQVDGLDGFRVSGSSVMSVPGASIEIVQTTVITKFGTDIVTATAGYSRYREADVRPLSDAFLGSINFSGRCR